MKYSRKTFAVILLCALCLAALLTGCKHKASAGASTSPQSKTVSTPAKVTYDDRLCGSDENLIFSVNAQGSQKVLSICVAKDQSHIAYRFGTKDNIELAYPSDASTSWSQFAYISNGKKDSTNYALSFVNSGYTYDVYQNYDDYAKKATVGVKVTNKTTGKATDIAGVLTSQQGSLAALKDSAKLANHLLVTTYQDNKRIFNSRGGYADIEMSVLKLSGPYAGIPKINEFFAGRQQYFADDYIAQGYLESAGIGNSPSAWFRSADYYYEAKLGTMLSISAGLNGCAGGVDWIGSESHLFDLNTGKQLDLSAVFKVSKTEYMNRIYSLVSQQVEAQIKEPKYRIGFFFEDAYSAEGQKAIKEFNPNDFCLTNDSIIINYQKYTLADGASGPQAYVLPYSDFKGMLAFNPY